jgi:hypothetical protein
VAAGLEHLDVVLAFELLVGGPVGAATFGGMRVWWADSDVCIGWTGPVGEARLEVPAASRAQAWFPPWLTRFPPLPARRAGTGTG